MGQVTITFKGICTHFKQSKNANLPVAHRTALVKADERNIIGGINIPPHFSKMTISATTDNPDSQTFALQGVRLAIRDAVGLVEYTNESVIPTLTTLMGGIEPLGAPAPWMLLDGECVNAYFDFDSGSFSACFTGMGAVQVNAVVTTPAIVPPPAEGETVVLTLTPFDGVSNPTNPPAPKELVLRSPATITIANIADEKGEMLDPRSHFLLHYLFATVLPSVPQVPLFSDIEPSCDATLLIDAGCSDSNYP